MTRVKKDLTGQKFGKLTAIEQVDDYISPKGKHCARWLCECECDNKKIIVKGDSLKNGHTKSCGCYCKERLKEKHTKHNDYEVCGDYVIMYTSKYEPFLVGIEDFWKVKDITWYKIDSGYLCNKSRGQNVVLIHRFIMNCPDNMLVDHKNGDVTNNIRDNLRIVTDSKNNMNRQTQSNNISGVAGVRFDNTRQKWVARIGIDNESIWLGSYENIDDAIKARKEAEEKYFGEYSYDYSRCNINRIVRKELYDV